MCVLQDIKWRIHLDLADLYKRNNFMDEVCAVVMSSTLRKFLNFTCFSNLVPQARQHFAQVCRLQPRAATGWLEWSKMDEENGKIHVALEILLLGLKVCPANEMLLTKVRSVQFLYLCGVYVCEVVSRLTMLSYCVAP